MSLTLYYHPLSSFCWKVLVALYEREIPFEKRLIDLGNAQDRAALEVIWPLVKFPVIRDHERKRDIPETTIIIDYLERYVAGGNRLIPDDWDEAMEVRLWDRFCDQYLQGPMQQLVVDRMRNTQRDMTPERAMLSRAYRVLDRHLASRTWVGQGFSMADCAAAPALFYASTIETFSSDAAHLSAYFDRLTTRPSVRRVIDEARPYFSMYPFADAIPDRFLTEH